MRYRYYGLLWVDGPFTAERIHFANDACRSIAFYVDGRVPRAPGVPPPGGPSHHGAGEDGSRAISLVLRTISASRRLPNLRHIALRYTDIGFSDAFKHLEQDPFPPQVARLSIDYAFIDHPSLDAQGVLWLLWTETRNNTRRFGPLRDKTRYGTRAVPVTVSPHIRTLRHLALSGVMTAFMMAILQVCPHVETLQIAEPSAVRLSAIGPLPCATTTVTLRHPGAVPRSRILRWNLGHAVGSGLFCARRGVGVTPRIIVRSGTPERVAFLGTRRCCGRFSVELVHEPDGS